MSAHLSILALPSWAEWVSLVGATKENILCNHQKWGRHESSQGPIRHKKQQSYLFSNMRPQETLVTYPVFPRLLWKLSSCWSPLWTIFCHISMNNTLHCKWAFSLTQFSDDDTWMTGYGYFRLNLLKQILVTKYVSAISSTYLGSLWGAGIIHNNHICYQAIGRKGP
jgi:hypothetical protein